METAKLFKIGRSQAIRLSEHFHFAETEVAIRKDGDIDFGIQCDVSITGGHVNGGVRGRLSK